MAKTLLITAGVWLYLVMSHMELFSASYIHTDAMSQEPQLLSSPVQPNISWDFLLLAIQWPQSFCYDVLDMRYTNSCIVPSNVSQWTVHGLWPSKFNGDDVFNCNTSYPFNESQIEDILPELKKYWPVMFPPNTSKLWAHEWNKHGSCAGIVPQLKGEHNYFKTTIDLVKQFKFDSMLEAQKIVPSNTTLYKADNFTQAIKTAIGQIPVIECYTTVQEVEQITYVQQITICINKTFQPIECPKSGFGFIQGNCGDRNLTYPIITHK